MYRHKSQVLSGYKAITKDSDDEIIAGTMPERNAWTTSVSMNGSVIIPEGHHNGSGKVNGPQVTQRGAWTSGLGINGKVMIPEGYHNGSGYVNQSITTMGGQSITPSASQQTIACSGKYMTGNITINSFGECYTFNKVFSGNETIPNNNIGVTVKNNYIPTANVYALIFEIIFYGAGKNQHHYDFVFTSTKINRGVDNNALVDCCVGYKSYNDTYNFVYKITNINYYGASLTWNIYELRRK